MPPADVARPRLVVLADDLTGAADAAAPFAAARGLDVSVALTAETAQTVDVLALVTDNRWRPAEEAAARMHAAVDRVSQPHVGLERGVPAHLTDERLDRLEEGRQEGGRAATIEASWKSTSAAEN